MADEHLSHEEIAAARGGARLSRGVRRGPAGVPDRAGGMGPTIPVLERIALALETELIVAFGSHSA